MSNITKVSVGYIAKEDKGKRLKDSVKNAKAQLKRREDKIARLEAKVARLEEEAKKKLRSPLWTKFSGLLQNHPRTSVLGVRRQIRDLAQMRNKLQHSRYLPVGQVCFLNIKIFHPWTVNLQPLASTCQIKVLHHLPERKRFLDPAQLTLLEC